MIVKIKNTGLSNGKYTDQDGQVWTVARLIEHSKGLPVFKIPIAGIDIGRNVFDNVAKDARSLAEHVKRVHDTDLKYPVLLDPNGFIMDGWHRVVKALVQGEEYISAVRFEELPCHEYVEEQQ